MKTNNTTVLCYVTLLVLAMGMFSCNNNSSTKNQQPELYSRNEYSRNGVEYKYTYSFKTKEGIIDEASRRLRSTEQYDSLGNVIYYKGDFYPSIRDFAVSTYHYKIREALDLPYSATYTYKMEYKDTSLVKASVFDENGKYMARIEECVKGNVIEDSVYVKGALKDRLIYVQHIYKNVDGRDSLNCSYDNEFGVNLTLAEERKTNYSKEGNTLRQEYVWKSREYRNPKKYRTRNSSSVLTFDEKGRLIYSDFGGYKTSYSYDSRGFEVESITEDGHNKSLYKNEFHDNGLLKCSYTYADMTICQSYYEYEYKLYPYSNAIIESK